MLQVAKGLVKRLPYPVFLRAYDLWDSLVVQRRCGHFREQAGLPTLDEFDMRGAKTSDTLFLLGSGPSINRISDERWSAIARHDAWGFNFWPFHRFVPRLYFFEAIDQKTWPHILAAYVKLTHEHGERYANVPKIITELQNDPNNSMLAGISPEFKRNLYAINVTRPAARTPEEFRAAVRYLRAKGVFEPSWPWGKAFKYGSTLSLLIGLAARLEYKRIILCGVDLKTTEYFFQDRSLYPDSADLILEPPNQKHMAIRDFEWLVKIDAVISILSDVVLRPKGISVLVENRSSALWPGLDELVM